MNKFTKDTFYTVITRFARLLVNILTSVIIARTLGPEGKGIYSIITILPGLLVSFANLGIGQATVYYIGQKKYPLKEILNTNIFFSLIISLFTIFIGSTIIFFFSNSLFPFAPKILLFSALLLVPLQIFFNFIVEIFLGLQKIKKYNFINLASQLSFLILIVLFFLFFHLNIKDLIITEAISLFIINIFLYFDLKKETDNIPPSINKSFLKDSLSFGAKSYLGYLFNSLGQYINVFLMNIFLNPAAIGFYSIAYAATEKLSYLVQSPAMVLFPKISAENNENNRRHFTPLICRTILFTITPLILILFFFSKFIISFLYSNVFLEAVGPLKILLLGTLVIGVSRTIGNDILGRGKPMITTYITIIAFIVLTALNILWIPRFGITGAAWAVTISYIINFLLKIIIYSKISGNKFRDIFLPHKEDFVIYKQILLSGLNYFKKYDKTKK